MKRACKGGGDLQQDFELLKQSMDAYGVGVRAGGITPQRDDEAHFRQKAGLPEMSDAVIGAWGEDGEVRRPITLKSQDAFESEQNQLANTDSTDNTDNTDNTVNQNE